MGWGAISNVDINGNVKCTGNLGVGSAAATNCINLAAEKYIRTEGSSTNNNTKALSIGGYGLFEMDAASVVGGRFKIDNTGRIGVAHTNPQSMLHLGNSEVFGSAPVIIFGKNNGPGFRNAFMGYSESFYFLIGDYGGTTGTITLTQQ